MLVKLLLPALIASFAVIGSSDPFSIAALLDSSEIGVPNVDADESLDNVTGVMFLLAGGLAVIFIIVGALRYVTAAGSPDKMQQAKSTIIFAIVGLVISLLAYAIVALAIGAVG